MLTHLRHLFSHPVGRAIGITFLINGFVFGSWTSCIPFIKDKFAFNEAQLGLLLLSMPLGVLVMNPLTVYALSRIGINRSIILFGALFGAFFALPISADFLPLVVVGLFAAGCVFACQNVAMNTYASDLEENHNMRLMSTCHGMWSLGAMSGALISSSSFGLFAKAIHSVQSPVIYFWLTALVTALATLMSRKNLNKIIAHAHHPSEGLKGAFSFFKPNATLLLLASVLICTYFTEGTMADWSAVYMKDILRSPETMVGWGFSMYAGFMAGGRFIGDELIHRYTNMVVLRIGGVLVVIGMVWIILASSAWLVLPGFVLVGLGISLASPILYGASARVPGLAPGAGLATMNSFGMVAFLTGPVIVGFIGKLIDLRFAFILVVVAACFWIFQVSKIIKKNNQVKD
jgi:MFS family permease